jgi:hypothetical protein
LFSHLGASLFQGVGTADYNDSRPVKQAQRQRKPLAQQERSILGLAVPTQRAGRPNRHEALPTLTAKKTDTSASKWAPELSLTAIQGGA